MVNINAKFMAYIKTTYECYLAVREREEEKTQMQVLKRAQRLVDTSSIVTTK